MLIMQSLFLFHNKELAPPVARDEGHVTGSGILHAPTSESCNGESVLSPTFVGVMSHAPPDLPQPTTSSIIVSRSAPHVTLPASPIERTRVAVLAPESHVAMDPFKVQETANALDPKCLPPITGSPS